MRYEMVQCDECAANTLADEADGWKLGDGVDYCPACDVARALDAEHDLSAAEGWQEPTCALCGATGAGVGWDALAGKVTCGPCGERIRGYR